MHTFKAGEPVVWDESRHRGDLPRMKATYGEGPHTVASVQPVDTSCTCGAARESERMPHHEQCSVRAIEDAGHDQFVKLVGIDQLFSGAWFLPVDS